MELSIKSMVANERMSPQGRSDRWAASVVGCHRHNTLFERKFEETGNGYIRERVERISGRRAELQIEKC